ncbi:hypothetical protein BC830DRAFT_143478, partial [Chytriomyces sp. MP71]
MSCQRYPGGYCSQYTTYDVFVSSNHTIAGIESMMKTSGMDLLLSLQASAPYNTCVGSFLELTCYSAYPKCENGIAVEVACQSLCQSTRDLCDILFSNFGKAQLLPSCTGSVLGASIIYAKATPCLGESTIIPITNSTEQYQCPSILLPNPSYTSIVPENASSVDGQTCVGPCCVPCPLLPHLYPPEFNTIWAKWKFIVILSILGSLFILSSYVIEKGSNNDYPRYMIKHFMFGILVSHIGSSFSLIPERTVCIDSITEATQSNSTLCLMQGLLFLGGLFYTVCYMSIFSMSLHLLVVWNKCTFSNYRWTLFYSSVIISVTSVSSLAIVGGIRTNGQTCIFKADNLMAILFMYPVAICAAPACFSNIWTVYHILGSYFSNLNRSESGKIPDLEPIPSVKATRVQDSSLPRHCRSGGDSAVTRHHGHSMADHERDGPQMRRVQSGNSLHTLSHKNSDTNEPISRLLVLQAPCDSLNRRLLRTASDNALKATEIPETQTGTSTSFNAGLKRLLLNEFDEKQSHEQTGVKKLEAAEQQEPDVKQRSSHSTLPAYLKKKEMRGAKGCHSASNLIQEYSRDSSLRPSALKATSVANIVAVVAPVVSKATHLTKLSGRPIAITMVFVFIFFVAWVSGCDA